MTRHSRFAPILAVPLAMMAAGCSDDMEPAPDESELSEAQDLESSTDDYGIEAKDFDNLRLGALIEGPMGTEILGSFAMADEESGTDVSIGDMKAYVACPEDMESCTPASLPKDTIYTYVYRITPGVDEPNGDKLPRPDKVVPIEQVDSFRIAVPATGYAGNAGYSLIEARAALGSQGSFRMLCDEGMLSWEVASGQQWQTGEPITFYWQSTTAPLGPIDAFIIEGSDMQGVAPGPSPSDRDTADKTGCT